MMRLEYAQNQSFWVVLLARSLCICEAEEQVVEAKLQQGLRITR